MGGGLAWWVLSRDGISAWVLIAPFAAFLALVVGHERVIRKRRAAERSVALFERGLARLDDAWQGTGATGLEFADPEHPCQADLDLFGVGSLFQLVSTARTRRGEEVLAGWLKRASSPSDVLKRQEAIDELRGELDLREDLALLGDEAGAALHPERIQEWGERPALGRLRTLRILAFVFSLLPIVTTILAFSTEIGPVPAMVAVVLGLSGSAWGSSRMREMVGRSVKSSEELRLLAHLLRRFENAPFRSPRLVELQAELRVDSEPPSKRIEDLERLHTMLDAERHQLFAPIAATLLWGVQWSLAIEAWRVRHGRRFSVWLDAVGEMEALNSLAAYAFERPNDPFPILEDGQGPVFSAEGLGHPLLPEATCVRNDVHLSRELALLVVSGSNMSGKSTLLRSVGVNAVLAQAGAPVRATRLSMGPLAVGASIRVSDSLQEGKSRFYAEIERLALILKMARDDPRPVLFLLDEVLHGTNSHDRRIGAGAMAKSFLERGAIGLLTTHDLALADAVDELEGRAKNVHFEDEIIEGEIRFDYRMREGVVRKSNAIEWMRAVGIDV